MPDPTPDAAAPSPARPTAPRLLAAAACLALLVLFCALSLFGVRHKSATSDEPMHAAAAYALAHHGDFRANPEDPNLWQRWAMLAVPNDALKVDFASPQWTGVFKNEFIRWAWSVDTLYYTPGNDADAFLWCMRVMLVLLGAALGAVVAWWSGRLGGPVAAVVATALFCLDPNFLAHASQIKNDVAVSLVAAALALALWRAGTRLTVANAIAVVLLLGVAPATKFSGLLMFPVAGLLLLGRALLPTSWPVFSKVLSTRPKRLAAAAALGLAGLAAAYAIVWATYNFRFTPAPDPALAFDTRSKLPGVARMDIIASHPDRPTATPDEIKAWTPGPLVRFTLWSQDNRFLPQTFSHGLLYTYATSRVRTGFLHDKLSHVGFPAYFPLAFLYKTPIATIVAILAAVALAIAVAIRPRFRANVSPSADTPPAFTITWAVACLLLPPAIYLAVAMRSNLNIGFRHALPVLPALYILAGWAAATAVRLWGPRLLIVAAALVAATAVETLAATPNYLAFFNTAVGGARGGIDLLGDSNLDWGQDLPALAEWQKKNLHRRLQLSYFGNASPSFYGIRFLPAPGHSPHVRAGAADPSSMPGEPGVIAISATNLQGIYLTPEERVALKPYRTAQPVQVLNGTLYLFDLAQRR